MCDGEGGLCGWPTTALHREKEEESNSPPLHEKKLRSQPLMCGEAKKGVEHKPFVRYHPQTKASLCGWDVKKGVRRKRDRTACAWLPHTERVALAGSQQKEERMGSGDDMEYLLFAAAMRGAVMCWGSTRHCVVGMRVWRKGMGGWQATINSVTDSHSHPPPQQENPRREERRPFFPALHFAGEPSAGRRLRFRFLFLFGFTACRD